MNVKWHYELKYFVARTSYLSCRFCNFYTRFQFFFYFHFNVSFSYFISVFFICLLRKGTGYKWFLERPAGNGTRWMFSCLQYRISITNRRRKDQGQFLPLLRHDQLCKRRI